MLCHFSMECLPLFLQNSGGAASSAKCQGSFVRLNESGPTVPSQPEKVEAYLEVTKRNLIHQEKTNGK